MWPIFADKNQPYQRLSAASVKIRVPFLKNAKVVSYTDDTDLTDSRGRFRSAGLGQGMPIRL